MKIIALLSLSLASLSIHAGPPAMSADAKTDVHERNVVWEGYAHYQNSKDPTIAILGAGLLAAYRDNPSLAGEEVGKLLIEQGKDLEQRRSTSGSNVHTLANWSDAIHAFALYAESEPTVGLKGKVVAKMTEILLDPVVRGAEAVVNRADQIHTNRDLESMSIFSHAFEENIFREVGALYVSNPEAQVAFEFAIRPKLGASPNEPPEKILDRDDDFRRNSQMDEFLKNFRDPHQAIEKLGHLLQGKFDAEQKAQRAEAERLLQMKRAEEKSVERQKQIDEITNFSADVQNEELRSGIFVASTLIGFGNPQLGKRIFVFGNALLSLQNAAENYEKVQTLRKLSESSGTAAATGIVASGALALTGSYLSAALAIFQVMDKGPSDQEIMIDLFKKMADRIDKQFEQTDAMLNQIWSGMMDQFLLVRQDLAQLQHSVGYIERSQAELAQSIENAQALVLQQLISQSKQDQRRKVEASLRIPHLQQETFEGAVDAAYDWGAEDSADENYRGKTDYQSNPAPSEAVYLKMDWGFRFNVLKHIANAYDRKVQYKSDVDPTPSMTVWSAASDAYMSLIRSRWETWSKELKFRDTGEQIPYTEKLIETGERIQHDLDDLYSGSRELGALRKGKDYPQLLVLELQAYSASIDDLKVAIAAEKKAYEDKNLTGLDVLGDRAANLKLVPNVSLKNLPAKIGYRPPTQASFSGWTAVYPRNFDKLLDPTDRLALAMGIVKKMDVYVPSALPMGNYPVQMSLDGLTVLLRYLSPSAIRKNNTGNFIPKYDAMMGLLAQDGGNYSIDVLASESWFNGSTALKEWYRKYHDDVSLADRPQDLARATAERNALPGGQDHSNPLLTLSAEVELQRREYASEIDRKLEGYRKDFTSQFALDVMNEKETIAVVARRLDEIVERIRLLTELGYSHSYAYDDEVRGILFGKGRLMQSGEIIQWITDDPTRFSLNTLESQIRDRSQKAKTIFEKNLSSRQPFEIVDGTLSRLKSLKELEFIRDRVQ